jgi:UDP-glucuronate decarboxylase
MRILVTGAAGFVGSHLCRALIKDKHEVIGIDNLYTGNKNRILDLISNPKFELRIHDVTLPFFVKADAIMNLACPASPIHYQKDPIQTTRTSVLGALNLLELARKLDIPILQASTSEVYGDPIITPQEETYWGNVNPIGIRSCYDEGKRVAETLFFDYYRQYKTKIQVVRIFNTYGPGMDFNDGRVISNFIIQSLRNENITVYGDGSQTRSFCYITDLVSALIKFIGLDEKITGPINLGNPIEFSIVEIAEKIIKLMNSRSKIIHEPLPLDDPRQRRPDITRAKKLLAWEPQIQINEGLDRTIADFKARVLANQH